MLLMENKKQLPSLLPQLAKIAALLLLFLLVPLMPSSLRAPYLYLLFNALVVALGVEAGFLAAISGPRDDKKPSSAAAPLSSSTAASRTKPSDHGHAAAVATAHLVSRITSTTNTPTLPSSPQNVPADAVLIKDVIAPATTKTTKKKIKKCPSRASIFFIGSVDADVEDVDTMVHEEEEEEEEEGRKGAGELMSNQELLTKAEAFIGNFYNQLKMQREESWKKLQDLYHHHHYNAQAF